MGVGFLFVVLSGTIDVPWAGANYPMIIGGLVIVVACGVSLAREGRCR